MTISNDQRITARGIPMDLKVKDLAVLDFEEPLDRSSDLKGEIESAIRHLKRQMPVENTTPRVCFIDEACEAHVCPWKNLPMRGLGENALYQAKYLQEGKGALRWDWTIQGWRERDFRFYGNAIFFVQPEKRLAFLENLFPFEPEALVPVEALCLEAGELVRKTEPEKVVCILYMGDNHTSLMFQGPKESHLIKVSGGMRGFVNSCAEHWELDLTDPGASRSVRDCLARKDPQTLAAVRGSLEQWATQVQTELVSFEDLYRYSGRNAKNRVDALYLLSTDPLLSTSGFVADALKQHLCKAEFETSIKGLEDSCDIGLQSDFHHPRLLPAKILAMQGFGGLHRIDLSQTQRKPPLGAGDISTGIVISNQGVTAVQVSLG